MRIFAGLALACALAPPATATSVKPARPYTVEDLRAADPAELIREVGQSAGEGLAALAWGRDNRAVLYVRVPKLFDELALAHGDGSAGRRLKALGAAQLLILDDWGLEPFGVQARHDLLEILEDRYGRRSTIVTSQLPISDWHVVIGEATYADAILDRLVHNAHRLELIGESLRRSAPPSQA